MKREEEVVRVAVVVPADDISTAKAAFAQKQNSWGKHIPHEFGDHCKANKPGGYCGVRGSGGVVVVLVGGAREDRRTAAIATKSTATTEMRFGITAENFFLSRAPQRQ